QELLGLAYAIGDTLIKIVPTTIGLALAFSVLTYFWACNRDAAPWWRKKELVTDICYWFFIPLMARFVRIGLLLMGAAYIFGIKGEDALVAFYDDGHGPLA